MKINVFGAKRKTEEGRQFISYFGRLTKKNGEEVPCTIKFREDVGVPSYIPCTIEFDKKSANLVSETLTNVDDGKEVTYHTLWISGSYTQSEFVDNSLDDFE